MLTLYSLFCSLRVTSEAKKAEQNYPQPGRGMPRERWGTGEPSIQISLD